MIRSFAYDLTRIGVLLREKSGRSYAPFTGQVGDYLGLGRSPLVERPQFVDGVDDAAKAAPTFRPRLFACAIGSPALTPLHDAISEARASSGRLVRVDPGRLDR